MQLLSRSDSVDGLKILGAKVNRPQVAIGEVGDEKSENNDNN
jgi:hypothetical protein